MRKFTGCSMTLVLLLAMPAWAQKAAKEEKPAPQAEPAMSAAERAAAQKAVLEMMTQGVDPAKAPEDVKKMVAHIDGVMKAVASGMPDCQKAAAAAAAYVTKHKAEIDALNARLQAIQKEPGSQKAQEYQRYMIALLLPKMTSMQEVMTQFSEKCQAEAEKLKTLLGGPGK